MIHPFLTIFQIFDKKMIPHYRGPSSWVVPILGAHIFYWHFVIPSIFKSLYFLKWCPIFDSLPLLQFSEFNNFIWLQLIFNQRPLYPSLENSTTGIAIFNNQFRKYETLIFTIFWTNEIVQIVVISRITNKETRKYMKFWIS